jgi:hypothetical protein
MYNEQRKNEQRADLEKRRKEFNDMQTEESKKRDVYNKKIFSEIDIHAFERMAPADTAQKPNSIRGIKKTGILSSRQVVS